MVLNKGFTKVVSEVNLFSHSSDNELVSSINDLADSLDMLYEALSEELVDSIDDRDIGIDMDEWLFVVYLSKVINDLKENVDVVKGDSNISEDEFGHGSTSLMREYLSYGVFDIGDSLYIDMGSSGHKPYIGSVREDGYITNDNFKESVPVNEAVTMVLNQEGVKRENVFDNDELQFTPNTDNIYLKGDSKGYKRIKPEAIIDKLYINNNGKLASIKSLL